MNLGFHRTPHVEEHFTASETIRDIVIGMSDGLTVPFALAAGLSGAISSTRIIVTAGIAEIVAGSISMGLGGYLAARSDADQYAIERRREEQEVDEKPEVEALEVEEILQTYGLEKQESKTVVNALRQRRKSWIDFMMRFELGLEEPDPRRALVSAATIATSYMVGGCIPLAPYIFLAQAKSALLVSVGVTLAALLLFGVMKGRFTGAPHPFRSGLQTLFIGGVAAMVAYFLAKAVS
jgi:predicted membrane protein (TIGR00267 family)